MPARLSIVIPTHARETRLAFALEALAEQSANREDFEVIVVRSPSSPRPWTQAPVGLDVTFLDSPLAGPAAQRNVGWRAARADKVAFLDDDCRVSSDWVDRLMDYSDDDLIVQGRTEPDPDEAHLLFGLARSIRITSESGLYETCNIVYPKPVLEALGGFDEAYSYPWAEDTDLGLRARSAGTGLVFANDALAWHAVHANTLSQAVRGAEKRRDFPKLVARHAVLREGMSSRVFVNRAHRDIAFAVAGLAIGLVATRRRRVAIALGCAPYLTRLTREFAAAPGSKSVRRVVRFAMHVPSRAAVDAAETAWTVRGSVENRCLVI